MFENFNKEVALGVLGIALVTGVGGGWAHQYYKEGQNLAEKFSQTATVFPQEKTRLKEILLSSSPDSLIYFDRNGIGVGFSKAVLPSGAVMSVEKNTIDLNPDLSVYDSRCWGAPGVLDLAGGIFGDGDWSFKQPVPGPYKLKVIPPHGAHDRTVCSLVPVG